MNALSDLRATLDPSRKSWIESANEPTNDFSIQNLPFGIFSDRHHDARRVGVAIGDQIVDLAALQAAGLLNVSSPADVFSRDTLNHFIALGRDVWRSVRVQLSELLSRDTATLRDDAALRASVAGIHADRKIGRVRDASCKRSNTALRDNWIG